MQLLLVKFESIRNHNGSQAGGFEELICQLSHHEPPERGTQFVRKNGAGGDAGVECYWKLRDQSEHCWQAKYFLNNPSDSQWRQIDRSAKAAIQKHPSMTKYYVCVPVNLADARKKTKSGQQAKSSLDKWNDHVVDWKGFAKTKGMEVEFEYWGAHQIELKLTNEDPRCRGKLLYWFDSTTISNEKLIQCIEKQELTLGARYTPEFHVELPIARVLHGLISSEQFWDELAGIANEWCKQLEIYLRQKKPGKQQKLFDETKKEAKDLRAQFLAAMAQRDPNQLESCQRQAEYVVFKVGNCIDESYADEDPEPDPHQNGKSFSDYANDFLNETSTIEHWLARQPVQAAGSGALLVTGEAGSGKSHLFCDLAKQVVGDGKVAILLLGQQYRGGNPLVEILDHLDLNGKQYADVLGAIDSAGEASGQKSLILIDAINEGRHRSSWPDFLPALLVDIAKFPNIAIAISCRSRFDRLLVPPQLNYRLIRIEHQGFRGFEHRAASRYLSERGIAKPSAPITAPEFSNPLFLKTVSDALKAQGKTAWPKGNQGATRLFETYVNSLERIICEKRRVSANDRVVDKALSAVARELFPDNMFGIEWDRATELVNSFDTAVNPSESLLQMLLDEGALAEDVGWSSNSDEEEPHVVVRFSYERFSDHFIARNLVDQLSENDPSTLFQKDGPIEAFFEERRIHELAGVFQALSILVAEKYKKELWDLLPDKSEDDHWLFEIAFVDRLTQRAPAGFFDRTLELFNEIGSRGYLDQRLRILIELASEPDHPWNARRLHKHLLPMTLPERDDYWSTFVAVNDGVEDESEPETIVRAYIEWAQNGDLAGVEKERTLLCSITLTWFFTTTNRVTRDQATCALARLLSLFPDVVIELLDLFKTVNDPYVTERLMAAVYGGVCNSTDDSYLQQIADAVFEQLFESGERTPHLLTRDYARGVLEVALQRIFLSAEISPGKFRPPYKSKWPLENPLEITGSGGAIEKSLMGWVNDFGKYTMRCIHHWSPTPISVDKPQTWGELFEQFRLKLSEAQDGLFLGKYLNNWNNCHWSTDDSDSTKITREAVDESKEDFIKSLSPNLREEFRWNGGTHRKDSLASFSRKWAQRWIIKRCYELGWSAKLFDDFERSYSKSFGRRRGTIERVGKKYQRIAFMEFMAHLADNVHYKDDHDDDGQIRPYEGPWQPWKRDIDPTIWLRKTNDSGSDQWNKPIWWSPIAYRFGSCSDNERKNWVASESELPDFKKLVKVQSDCDQSIWFSLKGEASWRESVPAGVEEKLERDIWFRTNSIVIKRQDLQSLMNEVKDKDYIDPDFVGSNSTGHQVYFREYPWHQSSRIREMPVDWDRSFECDYWLPFAAYEWEKTDNDRSIEQSIGIYVPSPRLVKRMQLSPDLTRFDRWIDTQNRVRFQDPSVYLNGPQCALVECEAMTNELN